MSSKVLVGDVGGTSARFALAKKGADGRPVLEHFEKLQNKDFDSLAESVKHYMTTKGVEAESALFAVAGPVDSDGCAYLSNLRRWPQIIPADLQARLGIAKAKIVNDFAAMARAVPEVKSEHFVEILPGQQDMSAPQLVTGPGTGFGVATLLRLPSKTYHVLTGEGGHTAFAPRNLREAQLKDKLFDRHGYVSTEMVVGGAWLQPVFEMLSELHGVPHRELDPSEIMEAADEGDAVCLEVCELRARAIMGAVGDGVLTIGAKGGAVLTGTVAERMVKWLRTPGAANRFYQRGESHSSYMKNVPVHVMTDPEAPLIGAAALMFDFEDTTHG